MQDMAQNKAKRGMVDTYGLRSSCQWNVGVVMSLSIQRAITLLAC